jgi:hypothetical protein
MIYAKDSGELAVSGIEPLFAAYETAVFNLLYDAAIKFSCRGSNPELILRRNV